ncbi:MAG: [FeFe] hydrogenase H-cluster maturation GTPase HydF [Porphyromonadaceae bacterium]|nr:[FeFe] hydrogenase H-cluster maturation GTPase HydF [Porphyromonadaceae bacterium]
MSMTNTPNANRLHIAILGRTNSGKSSLINAITGQDTSVVSDIKGTTTDVVYKAMEIPKVGATLLIDTPGFDDHTILGKKRIEQTIKAIEKTDIAILICGSSSEQSDLSAEEEWFAILKERKIPIILVINKTDIQPPTAQLLARLQELFGQLPIEVSALQKSGIDAIHQAILEILPEDFGQQSITGDLVSKGDVVMLVMPQDAQAPKGRLILPQVQTTRELLDKGCVIISCTPDQMATSLTSLRSAPKLIITDSQAFKAVYELKPAESRLTSFSVLFAGYKGDINYFVRSAEAIESLTEQSRVLIAEACTHAPATEDIGRVKIPYLLRKKVGQGITIDVVAGKDFPDDLSQYDMVIHCGACMFNRKYVLSRIDKAKQQSVPVTNYGVAMAQLNGILSKIEI